jgi:hypothetical protein
VLSLKARENEGLCGHCLKLADFSIEHGHPQIGKWAAAIEKERKEKKRKERASVHIRVDGQHNCRHPLEGAKWQQQQPPLNVQFSFDPSYTSLPGCCCWLKDNKKKSCMYKRRAGQKKKGVHVYTT